MKGARLLSWRDGRLVQHAQSRSKYIGTGTSDSHSDDDHPGERRTYIYVGDDEPRKMTDEKVINGLRSRRAIMTTGPFVEFTLGGKHIGSNAKAKDGKIDAKAVIQAAPWVKVNTGTPSGPMARS